MTKVMRRTGRLSLAALTVAALGFGGSQAVASPAEVEAQACNPAVCNRICQSIPGSIGGFCTPDGGCSCYIGG